MAAYTIALEMNTDVDECHFFLWSLKGKKLHKESI